jgi:metalloendopeptidase OMA1, mitochondrial
MHRVFRPSLAATFRSSGSFLPREQFSTFTSTFQRARARPSWKRDFHSTLPKHRQAFDYRRFGAARVIFQRWAARPTFYYEIGGITAVTVGIYLANLEPVPVSGRYRFRIIPYTWEAWQGQQMYAQTMEEFGSKLMPPSSKEHRMVERVMQRLIPHSGLEGEEWEVHVIDDPMQNAFVIPGGKVFVFRGILDVAKGDDGLGAVLGHEIAHNVAHHAAERMSQSLPVYALLAVLSLVGLDPGIGNFVLNLAFTLPGSRSQEEEADYIGLMMMR